MTIPMNEQETVIDFFRCDQQASIWTEDVVMIEKIKGFMKSYPDDVHLEKQTSTSLSVTIPKKWVKMSPPRKVNLTDEEKQLRAERMRSMKKKQG